MKNIYVVLGMARSGTSVVTRALAAAGVDLGENLAPGDERWNPTGFWEDIDVVKKINHRLFKTMGEAWMSARLIDPAKQHGTHLAELETSAIDLLTSRMAHTNHWGFKDPRTTKVLSFWQRIFSKLNLNENYVITLRNPLSCARSFSYLSGERVESGLLFWLMHMVAAVEGTHNKRCIVVSYENVLQQPAVQIERMATYFGFSADHQAIDAYENLFLDKKLCHHVSNDAELSTHTNIAALTLCSRVYFLLTRIAKDELQFDSPEFSTSWQAIMSEFNYHYPLFCYADTILQRTRKLNKRISTIRKSMPWTLALPLRLIDSAVRGMRNNSREREVKL